MCGWVDGGLRQAARRRLFTARYAALGVIRGDPLVQFVHTGMDEARVTAIGRLPEGKGVLGLLALTRRHGHHHC